MNILAKLTGRLLLWMGGGTNSERVLINLRWLATDRFIRSIFGFVMTILVTRYLGPDQFGVLSYAVSYVGIFTAFAGLGLETIVIRELSKEIGKKDELLGTAFILRSAANVAAFFCILVSSCLMGAESSNRVLVIIISFGVFFNGWEVIDYWFQSQIQSKFNVIAKNLSSFFAIILRLLLILLKAPLITFAVAVGIDVVMNAAALFFAYRHASGAVLKWRFNKTVARSLLRESWPLMISALAISVYLRADQIMLEHFSSAYSVGIYAAAVKLSEIWYFIPLIISSSIFPILVRYRERDEQLYMTKFKKYVAALTLISTGIAVVTTTVSIIIVRLVYGAMYDDSAPILSIYIWAGIFVYIGVAASNWIIIENRQRTLVYATLAGAISNVGLNFILIPVLGGIGAAISTIVGYGVAGYFIFFAFATTRAMAITMTKALFLPWKYLIGEPT